MDITLILQFALFIVLMVLSAFFSSSETSLFSLNRLQLEQMRRDENPKINLIERLLSEPRRLIVTILIGNEFVNVAASVISASIVITLLGAENKLINLFIMVPILLLVGEITPKTLAIRNNQSFATFQSPLLEFFAKLIAPLRWIVRLVAEWFTTLVVGKELTRASIVTKDMVRTLAQEAVGDGVLDHDEAQYIEQIFNFGNHTVEDVMTPRSNVIFFPHDIPLAEALVELRKTRHSKVPVFREKRDEIVGILHARDLMGLDLEEIGASPEKFLQVLREPYFVPESKTVSDLFYAFRKRHRSVALAVDEYGGVTGLISMEDILECIFGEIPSPSDSQEDSALKVLEDGDVHIEAVLAIVQFNALLNASLDDSEFDTIGGYVLHEFGELPEEGASIVAEPFTFTVLSVEGNRIQALRVKRMEDSNLEDDGFSLEIGEDGVDVPGGRRADGDEHPEMDKN